MMIDSMELRKQISIFVRLSDWRAIREEAAKKGIPMTELCRRWMAKDLDRLRTSTGHGRSRDRGDDLDRTNPH